MNSPHSPYAMQEILPPPRTKEHLDEIRDFVSAQLMKVETTEYQISPVSDDIDVHSKPIIEQDKATQTLNPVFMAVPTPVNPWMRLGSHFLNMFCRQPFAYQILAIAALNVAAIECLENEPAIVAGAVLLAGTTTLFAYQNLTPVRAALDTLADRACDLFIPQPRPGIQ